MERKKRGKTERKWMKRRTLEKGKERENNWQRNK
jgi:hypothetical protein